MVIMGINEPSFRTEGQPEDRGNHLYDIHIYIFISIYTDIVSYILSFGQI